MTGLRAKFTECTSSIIPSARAAMALAEIASAYRDREMFLDAAMCGIAGHRNAWGQTPAELAPQLLLGAVNDLQAFLRTHTSRDWRRVMGLHLFASHGPGLRWWSHPSQTREVAHAVDAVRTEYYQLVMELADQHPSAGALLVSGFQLRGTLESEWEPVFPGHEVEPCGTTWGQDGIRFVGMGSAFHVLLSLGDYGGAHVVSQSAPEALITPGLVGWSIGAHAIETGDDTRFIEAAEEFAKDSHDRPDRGMAAWSSINQDLWAPHFRSRGLISRACASPSQAVKHVREADEVLPRDGGGWHSPVAHRYAHAIKAVRSFVDTDRDGIAAARTGYERGLRFDVPTAIDDHVLQFVARLESLAGLGEGDRWIHQLQEVTVLLDRMPIFGENEKRAITDSLNQAVPTSLLGLRQGWEYTGFEAVCREEQLHRILLALFRAEARVPSFSQVRHGPIEYGKDIVVCRESNGRRVLSMYSVKRGEIKKGNWNAEVRPQLEEMFQVPLEALGLPASIDEQEGILVCNAHVSPYAEPIVRGWMQDQFMKFGRTYRIMHIDDLVNYVRDNQLGGALRNALRQEGLFE